MQQQEFCGESVRRDACGAQLPERFAEGGSDDEGCRLGFHPKSFSF
jgi:hypothetical protein